MFQSKLSVFLGAYTVIGFAVMLIVFAKSLDAQTGFTNAAGPPIRILHPMPCHRFDPRTRGRSPVR